MFSAKCLVTQAQSPEEILRQLGEKMPIEKIHLHLSKDNFIAGETAWFKAYLMSDYLPDTISSVLFVELLKDSTHTLSRCVLPIFFGTTNGSLDLPDTLSAGTYMLRAWTANQLNQSPEFVYQRPLYIFGRRDLGSTSEPATGLHVRFFPESGNFVAGLPNVMAVKVTDEMGLPVAFTGNVYNSFNNSIASFSTLHDGMGFFEINPKAEEQYYLLREGDDGTRYPLPAAQSRGSVLSTIPHPQGHLFEIRSNEPDAAMKPAYMIGQMQHHPVFRKELRSERDLSGVIDTRKLRSGILHITLFTQDGIPLAERLCFVNNGEYRQAATLVADTISSASKSRNRFHVQLKDTVQGSFSISVTDPGVSLGKSSEETIISRFFLSADLRGTIHRPAWYFEKDDETTRTALDLLMMTHGWRRFKWTASSHPANPFRDPGFIRVSGKVTLRDSRKPFDNKSLLMYIIGSDSARSMQLTKTDAEGRFSVDSLLFFGGARLVLSDPRGRKGLFIDAVLDGDSLHRPYQLPGSTAVTTNRFDLVRMATQTQIAADYDWMKDGKGTLLDEVKVKVRTRSPLQELEERYARGMFTGTSTKSFDLANTGEALPYANIFEYLQSRVPGLEVGQVDASYVLYYRQGPMVSSMGEIPMTLFLNEVETDPSLIATIHASEIALVKIYSSFPGATGNGAGGVMAIWTKKENDLMDAGNGRSVNLGYSGFSVIREFYSPDYDMQPAEKSRPDRRGTLQWKPDIMISGVNPKIPVTFYNNDRAKKFRITVEGMTVDGKLLHIQQDLEEQ